MPHGIAISRFERRVLYVTINRILRYLSILSMLPLRLTSVPAVSTEVAPLGGEALYGVA